MAAPVGCVDDARRARSGRAAGESPPPRDGQRANIAVPAYFAAYEHAHDLPVVRPVSVDRVVDDDGLLVVHAGERQWRTRTLVNATGTWTHPFLPHYPGMEMFLGEQLHTVDYPGPEQFVGKRVLVVGGGASAVQFLGALAPLTDTLWVTRREPVWRGDDFTPRPGRRRSLSSSSESHRGCLRRVW